MKKCLYLLFLLLFIQNNGWSLYVKTLGNPQHPAVIFLHSGPGQSAALFEGTTAAALAAEGFFVVVYDRSGEGRSEVTTPAYRYDSAVAELNQVYQRYHLSSAALLAHGFGGTIAMRFVMAYPQKVRSMVLMGVPVNYQETFRTIIRSSRKIYTAINDTIGLRKLVELEQMDSAGIAYNNLCFAHASRNRFFNTRKLREEAGFAYVNFSKDTSLARAAAKLNPKANQGYWKNEQYTIQPLTNMLIAVKDVIPVYGIYGADDGLFSEQQINALKQQLGETHVRYLDDCSHNVFVDRQPACLAALKQWLR